MVSRSLCAFLIVLAVAHISSGAILDRSATEPDKCPDHHISTVHNTINCACEVREDLRGGAINLDKICDHWEPSFLEEPCASFRANGEVDLTAVSMTLERVVRHTFLLDSGASNENDGHELRLRSSRPAKLSFPPIGPPYPSPDPENCRYHCQCCYLCGIPCYEPWCDCNRYICRRTCYPLSHFCPLVP